MTPAMAAALRLAVRRGAEGVSVGSFDASDRGGAPLSYPAIAACVRRGWLARERGATCAQPYARDSYVITEAGRAAVGA